MNINSKFQSANSAEDLDVLVDTLADDNSVRGNTLAKNKDAINALMTSALALPAFAMASDIPTKNEVSYRYSQYVEDDAEQEKVIDGDLKRFEIEVHQFKILTLLGEDSSLTVSGLTESLSGASPWGTQKAEDNEQAELIMSGASISEARQDLAVKYTNYHETSSNSTSVGFSTENDYRSVYFGYDNEWQFNAKNTAIAVGMSIASDKINPSDWQEFDRISKADKQNYSYFVGLSQILSPKIIASINLSSSRQHGFLSDPYKLGDDRPVKRITHTLSGKYRQYIEGVNAGLQLDYRFYSDDWEIQSHTLDAAWVQNVSDSFQIIPSVRYYTQGEAWFYEPYATVGVVPEHISSDYRLSPYGSVSKRLKFVHRLNTWSYTLSFEQYQSDGDFSIDNVLIENPALVQFSRLTVGFDWTF